MFSNSRFNNICEKLLIDLGEIESQLNTICPVRMKSDLSRTQELQDQYRNLSNDVSKMAAKLSALPEQWAEFDSK